MTRTASSLSIVIPAYNEVDSLPILIDDLVGVLDGIDCPWWEIILVDDGSKDGTAATMRKLAAERPNIKAVLLRANFGKSAALMAGFEQAGGDIVFTMDADLQDSPHEIPAFIAMIEEGYDLVSGWKKTRHDPLEKRIASKFFNMIVRKVSGTELHDANCGFKAYRRWCLDGLALHGNQHRFVPAILSRRGAKIGELAVEHHERKYGASKYGLSRYFHGAADLATLILLTKFSQSPLYLFGFVAFPFILLGTLIFGYLGINHVMNLFDPTSGFPLNTRPILIVAVFLLLTGLMVFLIGLLAEFVLRTGSPQKGYWVKEVVRNAETPRPRG